MGVAALGPAGGGVVAGGDLPDGHVPGIGPRVFGDRGERPPDSTVAFRGDRVVAALATAAWASDWSTYPASGADPRPAADLRWQHRQRPGQQLRGVGAHIVVAGEQIRRQRQLGLGPARQVHPPALHPGVVPPDPVLLRPVDLYVGGVAVDGGISQHQRCPDHGRQHREPALVDLGQAGLDTGQPVRAVGLRVEPTGQPGRCGRRRDRRAHEQPAAGIGADPVQPGQAVLTGQQPRGHPDQQLTRGVTALTVLHRPDRAVELCNQAQPGGQLLHADQPRQPRQRRVRFADPQHRPRARRPPLGPFGRPLPTSYRCHPAGVLPQRRNRVFDNPILVAGQGICR